MNVALWGKALYSIPRVDREEWARTDLFGRWLVVTRAAVLVMTFTSAAIAGLLALRTGAFDGALFAIDAAGLLLAHATNNVINDLTDSWKGVDKGNYFRNKYGTQPIEQGLLTPKGAIGYAAVTGALALACGIALTIARGPVVLGLTAIGAVFVLFYTWPLKHIGLGEPAVVVVWGPLMTGGSYFVITGRLDEGVILASMPFSLAATSVLFGKHIDKLEADREKGVRTLPVLLGQRASRVVTIAMIGAMYAIVGWQIVRGFFGPSLLVVLGAGTAAWMLASAYAKPRPDARPAEFPEEVWPLWYSAYAFHHTRRFGILYVVGIALDVAVRRFLG
jgi:1,4-dihydroxy-2-naphthoate octaprenyltransferase